MPGRDAVITYPILGPHIYVMMYQIGASVHDHTEHALSVSDGPPPEP